ncbi:hypothetical protein DFR70_111268 [Nocardia tenerifensis]|uniref:Uncharacterized protein n=1 Tax=Nocardia tenerifensis TaxID=228006 RepID=A0A318JZI6_9NOCA|nr:hypothetical protein [Nocardia tenerifensis]PXX59881.1 hypothetical protein DFR70_111268 [Nocardia tenerifensis]
MRISVEGTQEGLRVRMRFEQYRRRLMSTRIVLALLAVQGSFTGLWATIAPHSWYTSFPGFGMHWTAADGPYNHHLAADVGAFFLALTAVTIAALVHNSTGAARMAGIGWVVFAVPHFVYHVFHRPAALSGVSFTLSLVGAALVLVLGAACLLLPPRGDIPLSDPAPVHVKFPRRRR